MSYTVNLEDRILVDLHRAATLAARPGIAVPSIDLEGIRQEVGSPSTKGALSRLIRSGRVQSVRKDLLVLPDATGRVTVDMAELIAVVAPPRYLITGGRALEKSRLTDQHAFSIIVLVPSKVVGFSFRGESAVFVTTREERIWGWRKSGPHYAEPERAIIDAVSSSRYGVSLPMAIGALHSAATRDPNFIGRLAKAARHYNSQTVSRRLGLLVERLVGEDAASPFREQIGTSRKPVLLRAGGASKGPIDRKWRVIMNAGIELEEVPA